MASPELQLRLLALYPERMNIYADRGNLMFLQRRCQWRGIGFELSSVSIGERFDPAAHDLIYIGGGQDSDQRAVAGDLRESKRQSVAEAIEADVAVLAVCGGYQLLGRHYQLGGERIEGLGVIDAETIREEGERLIGNVAIEVDLGRGKQILAGFENHGGRTRLGPAETPLGRVLAGHGNNGSDGVEGVRRRELVGTYLHGPLLPKNAWLADHMTAAGLAHHHGARPTLDPLDDQLERAAHQSAREAAGLA